MVDMTSSLAISPLLWRSGGFTTAVGNGSMEMEYQLVTPSTIAHTTC